MGANTTRGIHQLETYIQPLTTSADSHWHFVANVVVQFDKGLKLHIRVRCFRCTHLRIMSPCCRLARCSAGLPASLELIQCTSSAFWS